MRTAGRKAPPRKSTAGKKSVYLLGGFALLFLAAYAVIQLDYVTTSRAKAINAPNVILISVDTLRADYVGCYGGKKARTPHIDSLAADGVYFETAVSEVPLTLPAHCSLLTGTYPVTTGVHDNLGYTLADRHLTLAEILRKRGYSTGAFVGAFVLHSKWGLDQGFDTYDDEMKSRPASTGDPIPGLADSPVERRGEEVGRSALRWIGKQGNRSFFCWIHLFDPHDPYEPPEPFLSRYPKDPYAGEVAYADMVVGRILDTLRELQIYERSLIVLVGDHGEGLGEHRELTHGFFLYDSTLLIPLILKLPGTDRFSDRLPSVGGISQLVDVVPTILQVLGIDRPQQVQGTSLLAAILGKGTLENRTAYSETYYPNEFGWSELRAWRTEQHKYILAPRPELYDLLKDPPETHNLVEESSVLASRMKAELLTFEAKHQDQKAEAEAQTALSAQDLENLRALGYVAGPSRITPSPEVSLPDPKDKVEQYDLISRAMALIARQEYQQALTLLKDMKDRDPHVISVDSMIGQCYLQTGRFRAAQAALSGVVKADPSRLYPKIYLAQTHFQLGELDQAKTLFEQVVQRDSKSFQAFNYLGLIYSDQGQTARALEAFSKAVEIQDDAAAYQMLGYLYTKERRPREAARVLEKTVALEPDNGLARLYLANAYMLLGQRARGEEEYRKALDLDPSLKDRLP